ncbi:hypothetical protein BGZ46_001483 [Entomortierella lignicola]|nr:hypothetical protein BGZ46_001483 [Entomortierella lignicola]
MSLQVNFTTHGHDLKAAYEAILRPSDPKNGDNWVVFGYDKGTNDLKVLSQGNGGLEELQEEFVDGKIQYAFARVVDPYSQLSKFVLVAWCGDGVPESKKGLFNSHLADISRFLSGYHLQINARCDADVTPALIMRKLDEGSGSKYSTHKEYYQAERIQPLQSAYKRTEIPDIAALQRNPTKPEPAPKYNIGSKPVGYSPSSASTPSNPTKIADRVWPPPASSSSTSSAPSPPAPSNTAAPVSERSWKSSVGGSSYSAGANSFNKVQPPSSLSSYAQSSPEPVVNKAHQIRLEREAREKEERERIKREIAASEARNRQPETTSTASRLAEERRLQEEKEREREREREQEPPRNVGFNRVREERLAREKEERERAEAEDSARAAREAFKEREQNSLRDQAAARGDEQKRQLDQQKREREAKEEEERRAREQENALRRQQEEEARRRQEEEEQHSRQQEDDYAREEEERQLHQQQEEEEHQRQYEEEERQRQYEEEERQRQYEEEEERRRQEEVEEQERRLQHEVDAATEQSVALGADALLASTTPSAYHSDSVSAVVLYSYEKAEENEMSLIEGEIIRNVTELDVGWWSGESEDGTRSGLFPANYVEVIDSSHGHAAAAHAEPAVVAAEPAYEHHEHVEAHEDHHASEQHHASGHEHGQAAVALYDYQAGEPNEITFAEGETISAIDVRIVENDLWFVTDDWWSGTNAAGAKGLFPANYVELIS